MIYVAYGSNMAKEQMAVRCPDARLIGTGYIEGAQLEFYLHATVVRSRIKTSRSSAPTRVPVAVWEISEQDEQRLDCYEGYPDYYIKKTWPVRMADGSVIKGMLYLMNIIRTAPPAKSYYKGIANAYIALGFASEIKTVLEPALRRSFERTRR